MPQSKQGQEAGDHAQQYMAGEQIVIINNAGITEQRAREICDEKIFDVISRLSTEARAIGMERLRAFDARLARGLAHADSLTAMADPSFQVLLGKTQTYAASADSEEDHEILTKLLIERSLNKSKPIHMIIHRAVEVVDQIDEEALAGLMNLWFMQFSPGANNAHAGLKSLDDLAASFQSTGLPQGRSWLNRLDLLSCIRLGTPGTGGLRKWEDIQADRVPGYFARDISPNEVSDIKQGLEGIAHSASKLVAPDDLSRDLFRVEVITADRFAEEIKELNPHIPSEVVEELKSYLTDQRFFSPHSERMDKVLGFIEESLPHLHAYRIWWNSMMDAPIQVTQLGIAVAYANAKRFENLPNIGSLHDQLSD